MKPTTTTAISETENDENFCGGIWTD